MGITTYNPTTLEVTNKWEYSDFISIQPVNRSQLGSHEFIITVRKDRKNDTMKFSSEHRSQLLTEALRCRNQFERSKETLVSVEPRTSYLSLIFLFSFSPPPLLVSFLYSPSRPSAFRTTPNDLRATMSLSNINSIFVEISSLQTSLVRHEITRCVRDNAVQSRSVGSCDQYDTS